MLQDHTPGTDATPAGSLSAHYNASRLRTDTWHRVRDCARRLAAAKDEGIDAPAIARADAAGSATPAASGIVRADVSALIRAVGEGLETLAPIEKYWAFPGKRAFGELCACFDQGDYETLAKQTARIVRLLVSDVYRRLDIASAKVRDFADLAYVTELAENVSKRPRQETRPYFEVLVVDDLSTQQEVEVRQRLLELRRDEDEFIYEVVIVPTFEDALIAALLNYNVQCCVVRYNVALHSEHRLEVLDEYVAFLDELRYSEGAALGAERSLYLGRALKKLRPEIDLFLVTDAPVEQVAGDQSREFTRIFYRQEDYEELHLSIMKGIRDRYEAPFFNALRTYAQKPTGVFHAMPISRSKSIIKSHWIQDMGKLYGSTLLMAESSATTGGLDSLLQPHGPLKRAQESAARAFGARKTFFVTNGTSTANKIVMQAIVQPGDIVMLSHDCHKSHHYAVLMSGALPIYLDSYPLSDYSMYGAVPLAEIKRELLALKRADKLDRVKMLLLTNITFDGVTYDVQRVMEEILAIKPDMIFVWDEAWFAYGRYNPTLRRRTAMEGANLLRERFRGEEYRREYRAWKATFDKLDRSADATWIEHRLMADPDAAHVRVYATQSTHKTLTALRQGSMIQINDQDFEQRVSDAFDEAYMTHTSTSPNYPILASLDVGRRQVELEGYEFVQKTLELALMLRERLHTDAVLQRYFRVLGPKEMIPAQYRPSGFEYYYEPQRGWSAMEEAWRGDEFTLDPTRITLHIGRTGMDGDTFKKMLMDRHDIQINKTSRNTVLFMLHIGTTRGTVAHLVKVLTKIAQELDDKLAHQSTIARQAHQQKTASLMRDLPPLPNFSRFHRCFAPSADCTTPEGDMRKAFYYAYDEEHCEYLKLDGSVKRALDSKREVVSATFVTPYPPGFPVLVPGQVVSYEILAYLKALDVKEIHGYKPEYGLRVFTQDAVDRLDRESTPGDVRSRAMEVET